MCVGSLHMMTVVPHATSRTIVVSMNRRFGTVTGMPVTRNVRTVLVIAGYPQEPCTSTPTPVSIAPDTATGTADYPVITGSPIDWPPETPDVDVGYIIAIDPAITTTSRRLPGAIHPVSVHTDMTRDPTITGTATSGLPITGNVHPVIPIGVDPLVAHTCSLSPETGDPVTSRSPVSGNIQFF